MKILDSFKQKILSSEINLNDYYYKNNNDSLNQLTKITVKVIIEENKITVIFYLADSNIEISKQTFPVNYPQVITVENIISELVLK